ncbi:hypothetical protein [Paenibacillus gansuensis]|uniref:Uncharacterized protein n=1 Tax=Paenibacillus gansuensis TaxID=306542 RepID=A0ABW5PJQ7_9BACL
MAIKFSYSSALPFLQQHEVDYFDKFVNIRKGMRDQRIASWRESV